MRVILKKIRFDNVYALNKCLTKNKISFKSVLFLLFHIFLLYFICEAKLAASGEFLAAGFETRGYYPFSDPSLKRGTAEIINSGALTGNYTFKSFIENETVSGSRNASITGEFADKTNCPSIIWAKFYFFLENSFFNTRNNNHALIGGLAKTGVGGVARASIYNSEGTLTLGLFGPNSATRGSGVTPLLLNVWYCCEIEYDTLQNRMAIYLNGNLEREFSGLSSMTTVNELRLGWETWMLDQGGGILYDQALVTETRMPYQEQEMSIFAPPSFFGRIGMKFLVFLTKVNSGDQFKVHLTGTKGFQKQIFYRNGGVEKDFDFKVDLRSLQADDYILTIQFLNAEGSIIAEDIRNFNKPYDGVPASGINENSAVCYYGEPLFFINALGLGRSSVPFWTEKKYCNLEAGYFDKTQNPVNFTDYLDCADEVDTLVSGPLKDVTWINRSPNGVPYPTLEEIDYAIQRDKDHPALFFWQWMDEPISNNSGITGSSRANVPLVRSWTEQSHLNDSQHLVFSSEWATLTGFKTIQAYMLYPNWVADVYSFDIYPVEREEETGVEFAIAAEINERYYRYNYGLMPFSAWVETGDVRPLGHDHDVTLYPPTQEQLRMLCWIPIVHGAKGISWFHYFGAIPPQNFVQMNEVVRFTEEYKDIILDSEPKNISIIDDANVLGRRVDTMIRETETDIYIFAVRVTEVAGEVYENPAEEGDILVNFNISGFPLGNVTIEDVFSGFQTARHQEWDVSSSGQIFTLQLNDKVKPGSVVIGGGYLSSNSNVDYPTKWVYLFDGGDGILKGQSETSQESGTIDYSTGTIVCDFKRDIDAGTNKIRAGYVLNDTSARTITMANNQFSDTFKRCDVHVYRIPKSNIPDSDPPTPPSNLSAVAIAHNHVNMTWTKSTDNVGVAGYHIFKNGQWIAERLNPVFNDTSVLAETSCQYTIKAFDRSGNVSNESLPVTIVTPSRPIPPLASYYPFEGNVNDESGNNFHGVINGNPLLTSGKVGQAYLFDGVNDYMKITWDPSPVQGDDQSFTLAAWVHTNDTSGNHWILADDGIYRNFLFGLYSGKLSVKWRQGANNSDYTLSSNQTINGDWTHVAATYDSNSRNVKIYINGEICAIDDTNKPNGVRDFNVLQIGRGASSGTPENFEGIIDDVKVFKGALSDFEISNLYDPSNNNSFPEIQTIANQSKYEGALIQFDVQVDDDDKTDFITLSYSELPQGATISKMTNRTWHFEWQTDFSTNQNSPYTITFIANDGKGNSAPVNVEITVIDVSSDINLSNKPDWFKD